MNRVNVYIDGFNLYHAIDDLNDETLKWLDVWKLSKSVLLPGQVLSEVKYFSAYATWRPDSYKRHRDYVEAIESTGVVAIMGRFKEKRLKCKATCGEVYVTHEEKETDVNIGSHLIADALQDKFDTALIISADTVLAAVITLTKTLVGGNKRVCAVAPTGRFARSRELKHIFEITKGKLRASLLPHSIQTGSGIISIPDKYL